MLSIEELRSSIGYSKVSAFSVSSIAYKAFSRGEDHHFLLDLNINTGLHASGNSCILQTFPLGSHWIIWNLNNKKEQADMTIRSHFGLF
jgi:hypothetical protein